MKGRCYMSMLSKDAKKYIADSLENYVDLMDTCILRSINDEEKFNKACKKVKKVIKHLRKGKEDDFRLEVLDEHRDEIEEGARTYRHG